MSNTERAEALHPSRKRHHHQHSDLHPHTFDLPTPSDCGRPSTTNGAAQGSPKVAFTPGYPTRIPSLELAKPFDTHTQAGTTEMERAILREMDVARILNSAHILGYELDTTTAPPFDGPAVILYQANADPIEKLKALTMSFGKELSKLEPLLARQVEAPGDVRGHPEWRKWKEEAVLKMLTIIAPAMGKLLERLTATGGGAVQQHDGGVRFFVGQR